MLSATELQALEDAARGERDKLIIAVMAETGAREGEVANLGLGDLIQREGRFGFIRLRGKTGERLAPVSPALWRRLRAYAEGRSGRPRSTMERLFLAERRRKGAWVPLTTAGIHQAIRDAADRAGLGKRVYPHLLRHTAITRMVAAGMHPALVSDITGVGVAVISQHYCHPTDEDRWRAMAELWESRGR